MTVTETISFQRSGLGPALFTATLVQAAPLALRAELRADARLTTVKLGEEVSDLTFTRLVKLEQSERSARPGSIPPRVARRWDSAKVVGVDPMEGGVALSFTMDGPPEDLLQG